MKKIFVLGSINLDIVIEMENIPKKGETVIGKQTTYHHGGKGANQAIALARNNQSVMMIGAVGVDQDGKRLLNNLQKNNVDISQIKQVEIETGKAYINVDQTDNQIVVVPGANHHVQVNHVQQIIIQHSTPNDIFVAQLETPVQDVFNSIEFASTKGLFTVLNPSPFQVIPDSLFNKIGLLIVNEHELKHIMSDGKKTIADIVNQGTILVVTKGAKGACLYTKETFIEQETIQVNTVDTTGAGDAFLGAFVSWYTNGKSLQECLQAACIAGSLATTKIGAQESIPTEAEINAYLTTKKDTN